MILAHGLLAAVQRLAATAAGEPGPAAGVWEQVKGFIDTPAPYSPFSEYVLLLFLLWLLARREKGRADFNRKAQSVLEEKYAAGELSREAYEKYRQELSIRSRR